VVTVMSWRPASGPAGTGAAAGRWLGLAATAGELATRVSPASGEALAAQPASRPVPASPAASRSQGLMVTRMPHRCPAGGRDW
jgi:hypothetical protein